VLDRLSAAWLGMLGLGFVWRSCCSKKRILVNQSRKDGLGEAIRAPSGGHLRAAVKGVATFGKVLQKDAPIDIEEIQRKEGQSRDPVHISVSVPLESQLRHEKAEKVNSETATFSNETVTETEASGEHFRSH
jgi:hypothetical protein